MSDSEMRSTTIHVAVTVAIAIIVAVIGGFTTGALNTVMVLAAPTIIFIGAASAGVRAVRCNRAGGKWQIWQGGMWLLLMVFIGWVMLAISQVVAQ